ncbi:CotH kinase family protein [Maridesulfovibrio frigidus]|uniref:CotH kinase family protein n=1 Tax=Maridesulfovibrio frigidus TaxID=340956 RepID=UPI0004E0FCD6|nr:CotH kinase family protein [Maridesulfovibrio frigidus]
MRTIPAIIFSLLLVALVGNYTVRALSSFYRMQTALVPEATLDQNTMKYFLRAEFKKEWVKMTAETPLKDEESPLKTFHITVDQAALDSLNANLPISGRDHYVDAFMKIEDDENQYKIKMRYRGFISPHWLFKQKSLRIKMKKGQSHTMERKFNLVNPVHDYIITDQLAYGMARDLGIIAPDFYPARVFMNGEYMGVYMYLSQVDESLIRKHRIMPGSVYYGEKSRKDEHGVSTLWFNSTFWDKKASRNAEQKENREDIDFFITQTNSDSDVEFYNFFNTFLNKKDYYNFMSMDALFGTNHHDWAHNHKIYFDPYRGKFRPIAWDLRFWNRYPSKDLSNYLLQERVKLNPILEYEKDLATYALLQAYPPEYIAGKLDEYSENQKADLAADKYRDNGVSLEKYESWTSLPFTMAEYEKTIVERKNIYSLRYNFLRALFTDTRVSCLVEDHDQFKKLTFYVNGNTPTILTSHDNGLVLDYDRNGELDSNDLETDSVILYPGRKFKEGNIYGKNNSLFGYRRLINSPMEYTVFIADSPESFDLEQLSFTNALTGQDVHVKLVTEAEEVDSDSVHPWTLPLPVPETEVLFSGDVVVDENIEFGKNTTVIIEPGTTFMLAENASLFFYGKVLASGMATQPIRFIAKEEGKPWGIIAVQGEGASGSLFKYCEISGGSIAAKNLIHYTAPFNLHDMSKFEVSNCIIGENFVGDDAMHIAYATGVVKDCEFRNARSDGLDIDIADVTLTGNVFFNTGNDGLDVMTSNITASDNVFINIGDKGISVGEWTEATITDSLIINSVIGMAVKDKSRVKADNLIFVDAKEYSIAAFRKNLKYDEGGTMEAGTIYLVGNTYRATDSSSHVAVEAEIENKLPSLDSFRQTVGRKDDKYVMILDEVEARYAQ